MQFRKHVAGSFVLQCQVFGFRGFHRINVHPRAPILREGRTCHFNKCKSSAKGKCGKIMSRKSPPPPVGTCLVHFIYVQRIGGQSQVYEVCYFSSSLPSCLPYFNLRILQAANILRESFAYLREMDDKIRGTVRLAIEITYENFIFVATPAVHLPDDHLRSISSVQ